MRWIISADQDSIRIRWTFDGEVKLCVPDASMIDTVIRIGTIHGFEADKIDEFGLSRQKAGKVKAPLITDCAACLECRLENHIEDRYISEN